MIECPYCGADTDDEARYCNRCGERLAFDEQSREGFLDRSSIQYLQGVRHGARPIDPETTYHTQLREDIQSAFEDFSYLAGIDPLDLHDLLDVDREALAELDESLSPDTELDPAVRQALGVVALVSLLEDTYEGTTLDELRVRGSFIGE